MSQSSEQRYYGLCLLLCICMSNNNKQHSFQDPRENSFFKFKCPKRQRSGVQGTGKRGWVCVSLVPGESRGHKDHLPWELPGGESWSPDKRQKSLKAHGRCTRDAHKLASKRLAEGTQARATAML